MAPPDSWPKPGQNKVAPVGGYVTAAIWLSSDVKSCDSFHAHAARLIERWAPTLDGRADEHTCSLTLVDWPSCWLLAQKTPQGSGFLEGLRRGLDVQPRRSLLPLPHVVDRLQPSWRAWAAQDPNLQGGFCSAQFLRCGVTVLHAQEALLCRFM
jgi:hypothetical protein